MRHCVIRAETPADITTSSSCSHASLRVAPTRRAKRTTGYSRKGWLDGAAEQSSRKLLIGTLYISATMAECAGRPTYYNRREHVMTGYLENHDPSAGVSVSAYGTPPLPACVEVTTD